VSEPRHVQSYRIRPQSGAPRVAAEIVWELAPRANRGMCRATGFAHRVGSHRWRQKLCGSSLRERIEACAELQDSPTEWAPRVAAEIVWELALRANRGMCRVTGFAHRVGSYGWRQKLCRSSLRERIEACAELQDSPTKWAPMPNMN
jgi:hypothetical protein